MRMKLTRNLGMLLLGIWLILSGLIPLLSLSRKGGPEKGDGVSHP